MSRRLRIASFNLENLDDSADAAVPLETRMAVLRPQLLRLEADVLCLQEINGQRLRKGEPRRLIALDRLLEDTPYRDYARASTSGPGGGVADVHNVVILSRFPIVGSSELRHQLVEPPTHRMITAPEPSGDTERIRWDRPVMLTALDAGGARLHVLNIHLRAPLAAIIPGQKQGAFSWRSVGGWAEGFFIAAVKRAGQALEVRLMVDRLFDADPGALVAVCGDFNAGLDEVPTRIIRGAEEDTGSGELAPRALVPLERSVAEDRRYTVVHHGRPEMLDHILVSHGFMAYYRRFEVHNEALGDELVGFAEVSHDPASYHAPVAAEFALPSSEESTSDIEGP